MGEQSLGIIVMGLIILVDLVAIVLVLNMGGKHDAHRETPHKPEGGAIEAESVRRIREQNEAYARRAAELAAKASAPVVTSAPAATAEKPARPVPTADDAARAARREAAKAKRTGSAPAATAAATADVPASATVEAPAEAVVEAASPAETAPAAPAPVAEKAASPAGSGAIGSMSEDERARKREEALKRKAARK
ncbi:MAG: hypothetical protein SF029_02085 [bacterium]|nr:hypothetical protein [bacterium]